MNWAVKGILIGLGGLGLGATLVIFNKKTMEVAETSKEESSSSGGGSTSPTTTEMKPPTYQELLAAFRASPEGQAKVYVGGSKDFDYRGGGTSLGSVSGGGGVSIKDLLIGRAPGPEMTSEQRVSSRRKSASNVISQKYGYGPRTIPKPY